MKKKKKTPFQRLNMIGHQLQGVQFLISNDFDIALLVVDDLKSCSNRYFILNGHYEPSAVAA